MVSSAASVKKSWARRAVVFHLVLGAGVVLAGLGHQYVTGRLRPTAPTTRGQGTQVQELRQLLLAGGGQPSRNLKMQVEQTRASSTVQTRATASAEESSDESSSSSSADTGLSWLWILGGFAAAYLALSTAFLGAPPTAQLQMQQLQLPSGDALKTSSAQVVALIKAPQETMQALRTSNDQVNESLTRVEESLAESKEQAKIVKEELRNIMVNCRSVLQHCKSDSSLLIKNVATDAVSQAKDMFDAANKEFKAGAKETYLTSKESFEQAKVAATQQYSELDAQLQDKIQEAIPGAVSALQSTAKDMQSTISVMKSASTSMLDHMSTAGKAFDSQFNTAVKGQLSQLPEEVRPVAQGPVVQIQTMVHNTAEQFQRHTVPAMQRGFEQTGQDMAGMVKRLEIQATRNLNSAVPTAAAAVEVSTAVVAAGALKEVTTTRARGNRQLLPSPPLRQLLLQAKPIV